MEFKCFQKVFVISVISVMVVVLVESLDTEVEMKQPDALVRHFVKKKLVRFYELRNRMRKLLAQKDQKVTPLKSWDDEGRHENPSGEAKRTEQNEFWQRVSAESTSWLMEFRNKFEPRLRSILVASFTEFLQLLIPNTSKLGFHRKVQDSMDFKEKASLLGKFVQALPYKQLVKVPSDDGDTERQEVGVQIVQRTTREDFISDQESSSKGLNTYSMGNPAHKTHTGFEFPRYSDRRDMLSFKRSPYRRKPKFENNYKDQDAENVNLYDNYVPSSNKGSEKYLSVKSDYGDTAAAGHSHYTAKGHGGGYGSYGHHHYLDPFVILGILAFLTFLALLIQQLLMAAGIIPVVPGRNQALGSSIFRHQNQELDGAYEMWISILLSTLERTFLENRGSPTLYRSSDFQKLNDTSSLLATRECRANSEICPSLQKSRKVQQRFAKRPKL